jgi:hypothetical protein
MNHSATKKNAIKNTQNLDEKHTEMLNTFYTIDTETIPKLETEKKQLKYKLKNTPKNKIDTIMELYSRIDHVETQLKTLKTQRKTYLLDNSKYIFQYFEDKKKISSGDNQQNVNILNSFFRVKAKTEDSSDLNSNKYSNSKNLYFNYWKNVNGEIENINDFVIPSDICESCKKGELIPQEEEGVLICNNPLCGKFITYIVDSYKPSNKEPPNEVSYTAYIRLNHFKEILSQFQAKETTQIPKDVIDKIRNRIKKERITDISTINYDKMREILSKLGLNKYFEHIQYINSLFGINPPIMSEELHSTLCVLFIEIQKPWAIHCPPERSNFMNYTYTLYQLCVLLDQTQYLPYIPMMKDREIQLKQDMIWKLVCQDLDWEFFPTV